MPQTAAFRSYAQLQRWITPGLRYSQDIFQDFLERHAAPGVRWLDAGCGHHLLPLWKEEAEQRLVGRARLVVGIDADLPSLKKHRSFRHTAAAHLGALPFGDGSFELVTANMVVEHLSHPAAVFGEVRRVLRPGGVFLFHTPNALGHPTVLARLVPDAPKRLAVRLLEGRREEDVFPTYYRANTRRRIAALAAATGFEVEKLRLIATNAMLQAVPPLALVELLWIRLLLARPLRALRSNLIAVLRKPL